MADPGYALFFFVSRSLFLSLARTPSLSICLSVSLAVCLALSLTLSLPLSLNTNYLTQGIESGAIKRFFLIGGCDGAAESRNYFTDLAENVPETSVILTLGTP